MDRKEFNEIVVKGSKLGKTKVLGVRVPVRLMAKLEAKGFSSKDIQASIRNFLERMGEGV